MVDKKPLVSIIMPIRNEAQYIERALKTVLNQDYPGSMEIMIVDGMSTDGTRDIVSQVIASYPNKSIVIFDNRALIVPVALNIALLRAKGDILIRVDGHCELATDYVRHCVYELLRNDDIAGVGGSLETVGETFMAMTIAVAMSSPFGVGGSPFRTASNRAMLVDSIAFPAYKRETIEKIGLFDEELVRNQDDEYNYRIRKMGGKILLSPDIHSRYYSRASLGKLWKQYFQYGYWKVRVMQKHPHQMRPRQFVPPLFVLGLLLSFSLTVLTNLIPHDPHLVFFKLAYDTWFLIPGAYLLANIAASLNTVLRGDFRQTSPRVWRHLSLLPLVFAILHISYGLGFLIGLICFIHRWGDQEGKIPTFQPVDNVLGNGTP